MTTLRLGSRGSALAMAQSESTAAALEARHPSLTVEIVEIRTSGDKIQDVPLGPHLGQAFFTKEIEDALLEGRVDLAVHSCKDLATSLPDGLVLAAIPPREDARDALQETFLKCWRNRHQIDQVTNLRAWVFRIALNTGRDCRKAAWNRRRQSTRASLTGRRPPKQPRSQHLEEQLSCRPPS